VFSRLLPSEARRGSLGGQDLLQAPRNRGEWRFASCLAGLSDCVVSRLSTLYLTKPDRVRTAGAISLGGCLRNRVQANTDPRHPGRWRAPRARVGWHHHGHRAQLEWRPLRRQGAHRLQCGLRICSVGGPREGPPNHRVKAHGALVQSNAGRRPIAEVRRHQVALPSARPRQGIRWPPWNCRCSHRLGRGKAGR
jgi:hypothetical protein